MCASCCRARADPLEKEEEEDEEEEAEVLLTSYNKVTKGR